MVFKFGLSSTFNVSSDLLELSCNVKAFKQWGITGKKFLKKAKSDVDKAGL